MNRMTWSVLGLCVLAVVAAVVSFTDGTWMMGVIWLLIAGLMSNLAVFQVRRARRTGRDAASPAGNPVSPAGR